MGANLGGKDEDSISEINVTPFVDIILVVLIIFMVTTPIIMKPSININLPKAASGQETQAGQLSVSISKDGVLFLNGGQADKSKIAEFSAQLAKDKPDTQAVIAADKDVPHGTVIEVLDTIKAAGIHKFAISIDKK